MQNTYSLNGRTYNFGTIPPTKAVILEIEIAKLIGEPLFKAFTAGDGKGDANLKEAGAMAIGLLCSKADGESFLKMLRTVFEHTMCDGQRIEMDATFNGRNREMLQVFVYGLRYNFKDFFPEALIRSIQSQTAGLI